MKHTFSILFILLLTGCAETGKSQMQQAELLQLINTHQAPVVIDVRTQSEYAKSHIPGAIHIPFWAAFSPQQLENHPPEELLVLYCEHGPRAGLAKWALSMSGFDNMVYLQGHMTQWKQANLPVESSRNRIGK